MDGLLFRAGLKYKATSFLGLFHLNVFSHRLRLAPLFHSTLLRLAPLLHRCAPCCALLLQYAPALLLLLPPQQQQTLALLLRSIQQNVAFCLQHLGSSQDTSAKVFR